MRKEKEGQDLRKVTVLLPKDLIDRAMAATGEGLTPTIRRSLQSLAAADDYEQLRKMRGTVSLALNLQELRSDRD